MRSQFAFYKSFDDVYKDLNTKQKLEFIDTLLDVQFLRIKAEDVMFKDNILKHIWNAQKHSIQKSINGYLESQKNEKVKVPFLGIYDPLQIPSEGVHQQEQEKEQEKEKEKEEVKPFSFSLKKETQYSNLSEEYKTKLKSKCLLTDGNITRYENFILSLETKNYKYKDFSKAYMSWDKERAYKDYVPTPEYSLGDDWFRVKVSKDEILAINAKTYETKIGTIKRDETCDH